MYLGVPALHGRVSKDTYFYIIERMRRKLDGWKRNSLSLAGRVTLATSVLNSIPSYAMQTSILPISITNRIDRIIRDFVWGGTPEKRKTNLVSWDCVCRSKAQGGLGLRKARELNLAYLMKLGWAFIKDPSRLWVRVMTSKYLKETSAGPTLRRKTGGSALWRGIRSVWHTLVGAYQHSIRNGRDTLFWTSRWVGSDVILEDHARFELSEIEKKRTVVEVVDQNGEWDWHFLRRALPEDVIFIVAGMEPPTVDDREDEMIWGPNPKGKFSIKSAYEILDCSSLADAGNTWRTVWKWEGPSRIKHFLWLASHERVLTNAERCRMHIAQDSSWYRCSGVREDLLHVVKDCRLAREVWCSLFPLYAVNNFFTDDLQVWLHNGLQTTERLSKEWEVQIFHVYREANKVADMLADHGHSLSFGYVVNCVYSPEIDREIWNDFIGASTPRLVLENE
ncbi:Putative ribonuclease H protein At1g65750 [Linum perenne]